MPRRLFALPVAFSPCFWRAKLKTTWLRWGELLRYFLLSALALLADAACLTAAVEILGWHYLQGAVLGFIVGSIVAFWLSSEWAFREKSYQKWHSGFLVFSLIGLLGLGLNMALMWSFVQLLGVPYLAAKFMAALVSFLVNFLIRKLVLFTKTDIETPSSSVSMGEGV